MPKTTSESVIEWQFTVSEQGMMSRYGMLGGFFYKQYLRNGVAIPFLSPPRRISVPQYLLAKGAYDRQQAASR